MKSIKKALFIIGLVFGTLIGGVLIFVGAFFYQLTKPDTTEIKTYKELLDAYDYFSGAVLVAKADKILFHEARGFTDHTQKIPLEVDMPFNLASLSKPFTALAVAKLVEEKGLIFEEKVRAFLPDFPYEDITLQHLLWHTSGLPDYMWLAEEAKELHQLPQINNQHVLQLLQAKPKVKFKAGEKYEYSNTGYVVLALVVEALSDMSYKEYVESNILKPAGMTDSFVYNLKEKPEVKGWDWLPFYNLFPEESLKQDLTWLDGVVGDGNIYASTEDLFKWAQALWRGQLTRPETLAIIAQVGQTNDGKKHDYGFGWVIEKNGDVVWHNGSWVGFQSHLHINRKTQQVSILLSNDSFIHMDELVEEVLDLSK